MEQEVEPLLNPPAYAPLEVDDVDPAKDPRIGSLAKTPLGGEIEESQELPGPFLAVWNDRLVPVHAGEHGDDQAEKRGEAVDACPRALFRMI